MDLIDACIKNDINKVKELLDQECDVNFQDKHGNTALLYASIHGHKDIVELLLSTGECDSDKDKQSLILLFAVEAGQKDVVELLLDTDQYNNVNFQDSFGMSVLMIAVNQGHKDIVKLLLDTGKCNLNLQDKWNYTVFDYAVYQRDILKLL